MYNNTAFVEDINRLLWESFCRSAEANGFEFIGYDDTCAMIDKSDEKELNALCAKLGCTGKISVIQCPGAPQYRVSMCFPPIDKYIWILPEETAHTFCPVAAVIILLLWQYGGEDRGIEIINNAVIKHEIELAPTLTSGKNYNKHGLAGAVAQHICHKMCIDLAEKIDMNFGRNGHALIRGPYDTFESIRELYDRLCAPSSPEYKFFFRGVIFDVACVNDKYNVSTIRYTGRDEHAANFSTETILGVMLGCYITLSLVGDMPPIDEQLLRPAVGLRLGEELLGAWMEKVKLIGPQWVR